VETIPSAFVWFAGRPHEGVSDEDKAHRALQWRKRKFVKSHIYTYMQTEGICLLHHIIKDIGESIIYTAVKLFTLLYRIVLELELPRRKRKDKRNISKRGEVFRVEGRNRRRKSTMLERILSIMQ
jgi:hypothetical protein